MFPTAVPLRARTTTGRAFPRSDSPRRRFPSEKRVPVCVWAKSLLTFGRGRHLSRCHYCDTWSPPGATTAAGSPRKSGRATGLSFRGITGRNRSPFAPRHTRRREHTSSRRSAASRDGGHFPKARVRRRPPRLRRNITLTLRVRPRCRRLAMARGDRRATVIVTRSVAFAPRISVSARRRVKMDGLIEMPGIIVASAHLEKEQIHRG